MNKNILTNLVALLLCIVGYFSPSYSHIILTTGLFALSGGITNWLAIHMLFEKVPGLYGSGVIPSRFEEFKAGIKSLIINEFFNKAHIERFVSQNRAAAESDINDKIDFERIFAGLTEAIEESPLGSMLNMFGGKKALEPLREPVTIKLKAVVAELLDNNNDAAANEKLTSTLIEQVEEIIDGRLAELTPQKVKDIVQAMIRQHLGWLVVWGGVFGGLIGLCVSMTEHLS